MSKELERIYRIDQLLRHRYPPSMNELQKRLEVSHATVKRDLEFMRDRLNAPICFDRTRNGYRYEDDSFQLPGVWFTQAELSALLVLERVLQEGPLDKYAQELRRKLRALLQAGSGGGGERLSARIRVSSPGVRPCKSSHFETICTATVLRKRLKLAYFTRSRRASSERIVSPQQIICYRASWYFDAWCHHSSAMRRFAIDAIESVSLQDEPAHEAPPAESSGYGIFTGAAEQLARLVFEEPAARWIAKEVWHPRQTVKALPEGRIQLEVPFSHPQELVMDILRHGANVEVVSPRTLRAAVATAHREAALRYEAPKKAMAAGGLDDRLSSLA